MGVDSRITPKKLDGVTNAEIIIIFPALNFETEFKNIQSDDSKRWVVNMKKEHEKGHWGVKRHHSKQEGMLLLVLAIFTQIVQHQKGIVKTEEIW